MFNTLFKRGTGTVENLSAAQAKALYGNRDVVYVDVRGADEIARTGTIRGALRAPLPGLANFAKAEGGGLLPAADSGQKLVVVCASGNRSSIACRQLAEMGYPSVANLMGGFGQWLAVGGPTER